MVFNFVGTENLLQSTAAGNVGYLFASLYAKMYKPVFWLDTLYTRTNGLNPLNAELNPICHLLALLEVHHIFHVSGLRVNILTHQLREGLSFYTEWATKK